MSRARASSARSIRNSLAPGTSPSPVKGSMPRGKSNLEGPVWLANRGSGDRCNWIGGETSVEGGGNEEENPNNLWEMISWVGSNPNNLWDILCLWLMV